MHSVGFVLLPQFSHLGHAAAVEPLFVANWLLQRDAFGWCFGSRGAGAVPASNGLLTPVSGDLHMLDGCGTVCVVASFAWQDCLHDAQLLGWLRRRARFGTELCGLENGSFALAEAGLLDGRHVAVHWDNLFGFRERFPRVRAEALPWARDGKYLTCAGASAVLEMMVAWIGEREGLALGREVADHLLLARGRRATGPEADPMVARALALMRQSVAEPIACAEIARRAGLSLRQLERRFALGTGGSVRHAYTQVRLQQAHQLLQQTTTAVAEVATMCGFGSAEHFSRLYRRVFGCSPSADRRQVVAAAVMRGRGV